jgi:hypothetical protein
MCGLSLCVFLFLGGSPPTGPAAPSGLDGVTRVEEDWQLVLGDPDNLGCGPQITTTMSPVGDTRAESFSLNLNYRDDPFQVGGLQARSWVGDQAQAQSTYSGAQCLTTGETIRWTQRLTLSSGRAYFQVVSGSSTTWGTFGDANDGSALWVAMPSSVTTLDQYQPAESVGNSGAGWESDRVRQMTLVCVRYYQGDQLLATDANPRNLIGPTP